MDHTPLRLLFICGKNKARSPTAARLYAHDKRVEVRSAGLSPNAVRRVTEDDLCWADSALVMESRQALRLREAFAHLDELPKIGVLDIPDDYAFMDAELIELLTGSVEAYLSEV
jgi:predicted protein tyrosine phosphatase